MSHASVNGSKKFNLLRDLLAPEKSRQSDLSVLIKVLRDCYAPKKEYL